jgi:hypothetical protein
VRDFSTNVATLHKLTKKGVSFNWVPTHQQAFDTLKSKLTQAPLLQLPDFDKMFELECDASGLGIGGVLLQGGKPVAFFSEKLSGPSLNYSTYDKEFWCQEDGGRADHSLFFATIAVCCGALSGMMHHMQQS